MITEEKKLSPYFAELAAKATDRDRATKQAMFAGLVPGRSSTDIHCFDPWVIARVQPNSHRKARTNLLDMGFESWCPAGRRITHLPQRFIPPKKRVGKQIYLREALRFPYGDYIFLRRIFGNYPLSSLFDIPGVGGVCRGAGSFATIEDYEIELMRLAEFDGCYDRLDAPGISAKQFRLAVFVQSDAARERWANSPVQRKAVDESRARVSFVEAFGRITCVVTANGDLPVQSLT